jgi:hypothetical protein
MDKNFVRKKGNNRLRLLVRLWNFTGKGLKKMDEKKRIVKRNIVSTTRKTSSKPHQEIQKNEENSKCTSTALVYCNQWECFTRFLCLEENSEKDHDKILTENE